MKKYNGKKFHLKDEIFLSNFFLKSQVSIFMIMALVILLSGIIYFAYQKESAKKEAEIVAPEISPINSYVDDCIKLAAEDGLERIGLSGGYISIPESIERDPRAYLMNLPASGFKIPYWWHNGISAVPSEDFIRGQLESHINSELNNCINKFEPFAEKFEVSQLKAPAADVQFNENDVSVGLNYPLEIIRKDGRVKYNLENFKYSAPIRFKKVYELAKLIMERENKDYFLERKTIDLYSMDTGIPTTDMEARCKTKTWKLSEIKKKLMKLLRVNLPYIRIGGADYDPNLYVPAPSGENKYSNTYFQEHYIWDIDKDAEKFKNMKINFNYDDWPLKIYARPSENGILSSDAQKGTRMLSFLCLHVWHFTYDIDYPVIATVFDQEAKNNKPYNKPYQFNFAFKVSIDHNEPNRLNTGTALFDIEPDLSSDDYCNSLKNEMTIFTVNNATGEDIRGVNLSFACGRFYCGMGQSDWLSLGAAAGITKRFPYCVNGIIKGAKEGFAESGSFIPTDIDGSSYVLALNPIKEFKNYKVVKHFLSSPNSFEELAPNEKASISIKGKDIGFESSAVAPKEDGFSITLPDSKDAVYDVAVYISDDENIVGGYAGELKVSKEQLANAEQIIFHVIEQGDASEDERFLFISGLANYSKKVPPPELK